MTCHWRVLSLLYARESDGAVAAVEEAASLPEIAPLLRAYEPARRLIFEGEGQRLRAELRGNAFGDEAALRKAIRALGLWLR